MKVLVTGGAGFLGSHLCERLLADGHDVLCVDNYFTGTKRNIAHLLDNPKFELMRHDVTFPLYVEVDQIYNLACPASPVHYQHDPVQTTKTSVHGAINMLGLAKRVKARILQASTSEVYGDPEVHPQTGELLGARQPDRHPRPATTRASAAPRRCSSTTGASTTSASRSMRIFNTYGPRMHAERRPGGQQLHRPGAARGADHIYGDGTQTRSFCYVDDLIEGMVRLMDTPHASPGRSTSATRASSRCWSSPRRCWPDRLKLELIFKDLPADDPKQRQPDITLAQAELDWEPTVQLTEGLTRTIEYFRSVVPA